MRAFARFLAVAMTAVVYQVFAAAHTPTYFKLVVTEGGDNSTVCQISQLAFFDADHHYVSTNLEEKTTVSAASGLDENSFFSATVFTNIENQTHTYADGPIGVIFVDNDKKWCFKNDAHGGIGNYDNGNDGTVTLVMRLADDAEPVAYNFCSGNDDYKYKNRAFTSWKMYGSVNGSDWELCDEVSNLAPTNQNFAWYAGTITGTANAGCFPVGKVYDEARGALSVALGVVPGGIPQIELTSYGLGATNASVVLEWSAAGDFTDAIQSAMTIDGYACRAHASGRTRTRYYIHGARASDELEKRQHDTEHNVLCGSAATGDPGLPQARDVHRWLSDGRSDGRLPGSCPPFREQSYGIHVQRLLV